MVLIIDNGYGFPHSLVGAVGSYPGKFMIVSPENAVSEASNKKKPFRIIILARLYPGDTGWEKAIVNWAQKNIPILGIGFGHHALCTALGASLVPAKPLMHGKQENICIDNDEQIFTGLPKQIKGGSYYSYLIEKASLPDELSIIAENDTGSIMAVKHRVWQIYGLQFHPESHLTPLGGTLITNFLKSSGEIG